MANGSRRMSHINGENIGHNETSIMENRSTRKSHIKRRKNQECVTYNGEQIHHNESRRMANESLQHLLRSVTEFLLLVYSNAPAHAMKA